jgi:hypothetical protein
VLFKYLAQPMLKKYQSHWLEIKRDQALLRQNYRKEMRKMPWYTNPVITCKVLNRIARRYERSPLQNLKSILDNATESIWEKQQQYYDNCQQE